MQDKPKIRIKSCKSSKLKAKTGPFSAYQVLTSFIFNKTNRDKIFPWTKISIAQNDEPFKNQISK